MSEEQRPTLDPQILQAFYSEVAQNLRFLVDRIWTNSRFAASLLSALLALALTSLAFAVKEEPMVPHLLLALFLSLSPSLMVAVALIGRANLRREYSRYLEFVVVADKLQERLGLNAEFSFTRYPGDKSLLPARFAHEGVNSSEEFIRQNLQRQGSLHQYLRLLLDLFILLGGILLITTWWLVYTLH